MNTTTDKNTELARKARQLYMESSRLQEKARKLRLRIAMSTACGYAAIVNVDDDGNWCPHGVFPVSQHPEALRDTWGINWFVDGGSENLHVFNMEVDSSEDSSRTDHFVLVDGCSRGFCSDSEMGSGGVIAYFRDLSRARAFLRKKRLR